MNETTDTPKFQLPDDLVQSIGALNEMCSQQEDSAAAMMYRLMFRHESNINVLDRYADQILDALAGFGGEYAEEDYRNYLQYLQAVLPSEESRAFPRCRIPADIPRRQSFLSSDGAEALRGRSRC